MACVRVYIPRRGYIYCGKASKRLRKASSASALFILVWSSGRSSTYRSVNLERQLVIGASVGPGEVGPRQASTPSTLQGLMKSALEVWYEALYRHLNQRQQLSFSATKNLIARNHDCIFKDIRPNPPSRAGGLRRERSQGRYAPGDARYAQGPYERVPIYALLYQARKLPSISLACLASNSSD